MAPAKEPYYLTTAIAYPNGAPHIGHVYEVIASDAIARFHRLEGREVRFLTGTDEHGLKMAQSAAREGVTPFEWATRNADRFRAMDELYGVSFDRFIRTTDADHIAASQELWRRMAANGDIYLGRYEGWYSVRDEAYFDEAETTRHPDGRRTAPSGAPVEWVIEESYFFRLSAYQDRLLKLYEDEPGFIGPDARRNEVLAFVKRGLADLSISRTTFDWGVPVPDDPKHVMYVWVDALTNYVTGTGFPEDEDSFRRWWPADLHVIGKDIIRFHTVYWPAFLLSAGLPTPKRVFAHGFLNNKGEKMSKSVGNVLDPFTFAETYGVDAVRYFLLRETPFGQDGSYSHEAIVGRINADLANDLGNLAQRSLSMIAKNSEGRAPEPAAFSEADRAMLASVDALPGLVRKAFDDLALHQALSAIWAVVAEANRYFAGQEPWALKKTDPARMATVLYVTAETVRNVALLAQPFTPASAAKLLDLLGVAEDARGFDRLGEAGRLAPGTAFPAPQPVFPRFVEPEVAA
ncbi:methionine--tRNA ligase [Methylopila jiangsuensis]|uniref:Methionine--tRNA ligase n=1 Tax=Methylopila jiangsuensis TaxID=586230 RepID=A0A9W6JG07_9HYPH|nr:methionine--tRNA ligase [Methylopila jiangsuensis]MDR6285830.1 methionyl-tRNA synthetase [Methylopila jiangsuensis]GLK75588.1 methionine--tRNA ligase [Methylopila jiangsuensis]